MARRVLITGGSGFVGQWMSRELLRCGWETYAAALDETPPAGILTPEELNAVKRLTLDVTSDESVRRTLDASAPDAIIHLAGIAFPPAANSVPVRTYAVNTLGVVRVLAALSDRGAAGVRILVIGTGEQYGPHAAADYPLRETASLDPRSAYAASKAAQELAARQAHHAAGLLVVCTRSFNHAGPGQAPSYLLPSIVRRATRLPPHGGTLRMGNLTPVRDYLHVADVAVAYRLLLERGVPGEVYNVCSGRGVAVRDLVDRVLARIGVSAVIETDPALARPSDIPVSVGDNSKLRAATGWSPTRTMDDLIDELIHAAPE